MGKHVSFGHSRKFVKQLAMVLSGLLVAFGSVTAIAATSGNITLTTSNPNPPLNIETQADAPDSGVIGDTIVITAKATTGSLAGPLTSTGLYVTFAGPNGTTVNVPSSNIVIGSQTTVVDTITVTIPAGVVSGALTVGDTAGHQGILTPYSIWSSHTEPYTMPSGHLNVTYGDVKYILDQVKFGEAHAARTSNATAVVAAAAAGTLLNYSSARNSGLYPYDVISATRCLQPADLVAAGTSTVALTGNYAGVNFGPTGLSNGYAYSNLDPWGIRQVDGECNNITNVTAENPATYTNTVPNKADTAGWGASDQFFTRLSAATNKPGVVAPYTLNAVQKAYSNPTSYVKDASPRLISNLIADQSSANPAAVQASKDAFGTLYGSNPNTEVSVNATSGVASTSMQIPNITADYNVSAGYDSWFTLFGQFFDHGLDLIPKAGSQVFIPLDQSDPLYVNSSTAKNYMQLTRGSDSTGEQINITSPYVDQSQTYGSVASQNAWLREYAFTGAGNSPVSTGRMLEGSDFTARASGASTSPYALINVTLNGGLATWWDLKHQAARMGFHLSDYDAKSIPILATNQYGKFIPGPNKFPMMLFKNGAGQYKWVEGNPNAQIWTYPAGGAGVIGGNTAGALAGFTAVSTGHNFINDTMSSAVPNDGNGAMLQPDPDTIIQAPGTSATGYYDDEALNEHFVAGDGRVNENIGLSAVHNTFHSEHNTLVTDLETMLANNPVVTDAFLAEFTVAKNTATARADVLAGNWDGERVYQVARYIDEMEYQHMVYDEFVRRISPGLPVFVAYQPTTRPDITQEFASAVYRLGHSMLNETIARSNPGTVWDPANNQDVSLVTGFTNPSQARLPRPIVVASAVANTSTVVTYTVANGETVPENGSVVTISGLVETNGVPSLNIRNGLVSNANQGLKTFQIASYYNGTASAAQPLSVTASSTAASRTYTPVGNLNSNNWSTKEIQNNDGTVYIARASITSPGVSGYTYTPGQSAAAIAQGMSQQRGNEIDEFTTDAVRNNLLGAPLDLPSLNMTRGRDTGVPTLNQFRATTGGALKPYKSWNDFVAALRYPASAVNFIAAYGTDPSITTKVATTVTKVVSTPSGYTFTVASTSGLRASDAGKTNGSVVSISGFATARLNLQNAIVDTIPNGTTFTVSKYYLSSPSAPNSFVKGANVAGVDAGYTNLLKDATPQAVSNVGTVSATITKAGNVTRDTTIDERRTAAAAMMNNADFMASTGAWSLKETGFNNIDMWIGGLAENPAKQPLTPPMLGPTFQYVFDKQTLALQNGDRFYYLGRILGTNLNEEIPAQKLTDIVRRNSPSAGNSMIATANATKGIIGMNSPGFGVADCFFSTDSSVPASIDNSQGGNDFANNGMGDTKCPANTMRVDSTNNVVIHDGLDNVVGFGDQNSTNGVRIAGGAGDDSLQGTSGPDYLSGGTSGGDLIDGYAGDDILIGGPGEDLMKGGAGNDVLDTGESQAGDIADGGSGSDFIHNSNSTGVAASAIGEAGDDYIQGGSNNDLLLEGGEGSDWIEGNGGLDIVNGDAGPNAALVDMINGGDDVIDGGAGNDVINSDGGDDVVNLGEGTDLVGLGTGFDWINYENTTRFDNGPAAKPNVFIELAGGAIPNPALMPVDAVLDSEGVSGSPGNDTIIGRQAQNQVLTSTATPITAASPANAVYGKAGLSWLTINAASTTIDGGMLVTGNGIPKNVQTVGPPQVFTDATGLTTLQINLTSPLTANVTGTVSFKVWPLKRTSSVQGLASLVAGTPGSIAAGQPGSSTLVPLTVAGEWTGGTIMVGGAGNDALYAMGGSNIIHGSAQLHTCIVATANGAPFDKGSDVQCDGRNGYSGMTPLLTYLNNGDVNPSDLRTVREFVSTAVQVVAASSNGAQITYTVAKNTFAVGDLVTVTTANTNTSMSVNRVQVSAVTPTSFTVTAVAPAFTGAVTGTAVQSDDLYLPGLAAAYTIERLSTLPLGASTGYKITGPTGVDFAYDVQRIVFDALAGAAPTPLVLSNVYTPTTGNTGLSTAASSFGFAAGTVLLSPPFNPAIHTYTAIASAATTTTTPVATTAGTAKFVNGIANGTTALPVTINTTGTVTFAFGTATTNVYTVNFVAGGLVSTFDTPRSTASGFTVNITNCDRTNFTYTPTVNGGSAIIGDQIGTSCPVVVSGLGPRQGATLQVSAVSTAAFGTNPAGVGSVVGMSAAGAASQVVFDTPVATSTGFTVNIKNAPAGFSYSADVSGNTNWASTTVAFTGAGTTTGGVFTTTGAGDILVTVTSGDVGESALLTVTASRIGYPTASNVVIGTIGGTILTTPAIATTTPSWNNTNSTWNFTISNFDSGSNYSATLESVSGVGDVTIDNAGNVQISGLPQATAWRVTLDQSAAGTSGASKVVSNGTFATSPTPTVNVTPPALPTATADGFTFKITNYDSTGTYSVVSTSPGTANLVPDQVGNGTATVTVTGLGSNQAATVTIDFVAPLSSAAPTVTVYGVSQTAGAPTPIVDAAQTTPYQAVVGATTVNGFSFVVTNYDAAYSWNVTAAAPLAVDHVNIAGTTATYFISGVPINGTGTVSIATNLLAGGGASSPVSVTGNAYRSGLAVSAGTVLTKTAVAGITMNLTGYSALYTYGLAWSFTNAAGVKQAVPAGSAISLSNTGVVTISSPGRAIAAGSRVTFVITTNRQYYTTVVSTFTVTM